MSVAAGTRFGPYQVLGPLGAGGMGEVFRATDSRVGRTVALKLLPDELAGDPERLLRFEREARLLASLNHPSIAHLYGFETAAREDGATIHLIAMELVEGEGLSERMADGPIPVAEALPIARQIAEGLEAAHEKGIVHRDLKPANVRLTSDGDVKVLDFGLAKAWTGEARTPADLSQSPTLVDTATQAGVILGTAAYMSPEQARGRAVDRKTDVWAFGVVLWEMLAGRRLFGGETVSDVLAAVLTREVDWSLLPASTPPELKRLLRFCLERNPKNRLHDVADARLVLAELERGVGDEPAAPPPTPARRRVPAWGWAALALLAIVSGVLAARLRRPPPAPLATFHRLTNDRGYIYSARFSPDGATIVYGEASASMPVALYSTPADTSAPRKFDMASADVVGVSANGQMALVLGRHHTGSWLRVGTLAQAPVAGGAPRSLLENVYDADIAKDGASFAVVRDEGRGQRLEFPIGKVLYRASGWISSPRISADGRRIAFADHPIRGDDQGFVAVVDADGKSRRISGILNFLHGIVWAPDGVEVLASYGDIDRGTTIKAFRPDGSAREVLNSVGLAMLHDVSTGGRLLLTSESMSVSADGRLATGPGSFFATLFGESFAGISSDGRLFAGSSGSLGAGSEYRVFYRQSDGSAPVFLGDGYALGMTPDGRGVFAKTVSRDRTILRIEPTGPGETRRLDLGKVEIVPSASERVTSTADASRIGFLGVESGSPTRGYVFDLDGKKPPRAVTGDDVRAVQLSPRGDALAAVDAQGVLRIYPMDGGPPRAAPGVTGSDVPVAWTSSGDALFVWDRTLPAKVQRLDLSTGRRELAFEWTARDPAATLYGLLTVTTDARWYLMRYRRGTSSLAVADGVR